MDISRPARADSTISLPISLMSCSLGTWPVLFDAEHRYQSHGYPLFIVAQWHLDDGRLHRSRTSLLPSRMTVGRNRQARDPRSERMNATL